MGGREVDLAIGEDPPQVDLEPIDGEALGCVHGDTPRLLRVRARARVRMRVRIRVRVRVRVKGQGRLRVRVRP